jgi:hypothetical protein
MIRLHEVPFVIASSRASGRVGSCTNLSCLTRANGSTYHVPSCGAGTSIPPFSMQGAQGVGVPQGHCLSCTVDANGKIVCTNVECTTGRYFTGARAMGSNIPVPYRPPTPLPPTPSPPPGLLPPPGPPLIPVPATTIDPSLFSTGPSPVHRTAVGQACLATNAMALAACQGHWVATSFDRGIQPNGTPGTPGTTAPLLPADVVNLLAPGGIPAPWIGTATVYATYGTIGPAVSLYRYDAKRGFFQCTSVNWQFLTNGIFQINPNRAPLSFGMPGQFGDAATDITNAQGLLDQAALAMQSAVAADPTWTGSSQVANYQSAGALAVQAANQAANAAPSDSETLSQSAAATEAYGHLMADTTDKTAFQDATAVIGYAESTVAAASSVVTPILGGGPPAPTGGAPGGISPSVGPLPPGIGPLPTILTPPPKPTPPATTPPSGTTPPATTPPATNPPATTGTASSSNTTYYVVGAAAVVAVAGAAVLLMRHHKTATHGRANPRTFVQARQDILLDLQRRGWKVDGGLKIPHATNPSGELRLWFKPQAVYFAVRPYRTPFSFSFASARSTWIEDIRRLSPDEFVHKIDRMFNGRYSV